MFAVPKLSCWRDGACKVEHDDRPKDDKEGDGEAFVEVPHELEQAREKEQEGKLKHDRERCHNGWDMPTLQTIETQLTQ